MTLKKIINGELVDMTSAEIFEFSAIQNTILYPEKNNVKSDFTDWLNSIMEQITGPVPDDEKNVWPVKEAAAKAVLAGTGDATQTAILSAEATITGETIAALSTRILQKATIYRGVVARMAGLRRATEVALDAAIPSQYQDIINKAKAQAPLLVRDAGATI